MFRTEHEPHLWLNQVIAVGEGSIDGPGGPWCAGHALLLLAIVDYLPVLPIAADGDA